MRALLLAATMSAAGAAFTLSACESADNGKNPSAPSDAGTDGTAQSGPVKVQILAINDFHGNLAPPRGSGGLVPAPAADPIAQGGPDSGVVVTDAGIALVPAGGASYLATYLRMLTTTNKNTAIVSAGDLTGASPLVSNVFKDEPSVLVMNSIGLDFEGVGNHDFDRGLAELTRLQNGGCSVNDCDAGTFGGAKYKYLAANVVDMSTGKTVFPPYGIKDFGSVKVAFVGMTLEATPSVTVASAVQGLQFNNEASTVNALVPELKAQGVSAIVMLLHQGAFQGPEGTYDSCDELSGDLLPVLHGDPEAGTPGLDPAIDVVVSAHTHQPYDCTIDGRLVTSASSFGRVLTKVDLVIDPAAKKVVSKAARNIVVTHMVPPDPDVDGIVATYEAKSAPLANRVVGYVTADLTGNPKTAASASCETPLGDVIADAQLTATKDAANGGAVVAFMNPGGIRADIVAHAPPKADGSVTYAETFAVQPFSNILVTMTLTGQQILDALAAQFGGAEPKVLQISSSLSYSYTYDATMKKGTVDPASVMIAGAALDPAMSYRVTVNAFLAGGGDGFAPFAKGTDRVTGAIDLDALVAYLGTTTSASMPLKPPALTRVMGNGCM